MLNRVWVLNLVLLTISSRSLAQHSNVTTCIPDYQWSINSRKQTPCLVGAYLESACSSIDAIVDGIRPGLHYLGPTFALSDPCACNSVTYSVISACGGCQGRTFIPYSNWTINCPFIGPIGQFPRPIPAAIELPSWAKLDISLSNNTFDPTAAQREAARSNAFPSSSLGATVPPSSTSAAPSQTTSSTSETATLPTNVSQSSRGTSPGVIAGSVVGALVGIIIVLLIIFWFLLRAKRRRNPKPAPLDDPLTPIGEMRQGSPAGPFGHMHSRSLSDPTSIITPYLYSSSEMGPHPLSPGTASFYTTSHGRNSIDGVGSPLTTRNPPTALSHQTSPTVIANPRGYTGAAEV